MNKNQTFLCMKEQNNGSWWLFYSYMWLYRIKLQLFKSVIKPFFSMTSFYAYQLSYEPCILSFSYNSPILTFVYMFSHATSLQYQSCTFWCSSVICTSANFSKNTLCTRFLKLELWNNLQIRSYWQNNTHYLSDGKNIF